MGRLVLCAVLALNAASMKAVDVKVRPQIMIGRGDVRAEVRVERNAANRLLVLAWSSDRGIEGQSRWPLEGEDAAVLYVRELPSVPPAHYIFVASVFDAQGKLRAHADARIVTPDDGDGGR
jgi:hypothetical protein